jgi:diguanylate cyclase (GGDEF)-like protein
VLCGHFPKGVIGRLGGEEFVAFVQADPVEAEKMADHVRQEFAQAKLDVKGTGQIHVTVSVGCASGIGSSPDELLAKADHALYKAKSLGRNRVVRYDTEAGDRMEADNLVPFRTPVSRHTPPNLLGV